MILTMKFFNLINKNAFKICRKELISFWRQKMDNQLLEIYGLT